MFRGLRVKKNITGPSDLFPGFRGVRLLSVSKITLRLATGKPFQSHTKQQGQPLRGKSNFTRNQSTAGQRPELWGFLTIQRVRVVGREQRKRQTRDQLLWQTSISWMEKVSRLLQPHGTFYSQWLVLWLKIIGLLFFFFSSQGCWDIKSGGLMLKADTFEGILNYFPNHMQK